MGKKIPLLVTLLLMASIAEAKVITTKDKVDIVAVHTGIQNSLETRSESISADITLSNGEQYYGYFRVEN